MTSPFGAFAHFIRNVRSSRDYYSSPLQWPLTTSSECGTWSIRQFFPHKSGDKCVQTPKNRRMDHRIPPATLETEAQRPASAHPERKYHFPTLIFQHPASAPGVLDVPQDQVRNAVRADSPGQR